MALQIYSSMNSRQRLVYFLVRISVFLLLPLVQAAAITIEVAGLAPEGPSLHGTPIKMAAESNRHCSSTAKHWKEHK
jgi:hypothetical protein